MCPLLLALINFNDPIEESTSHFGHINLIADNSLIPESAVLKRQIKYITFSLSSFFLQLNINKIKQILILNFPTIFQILKYTLLNFEKSTFNITIFISFRWILLEKCWSLQQFIHDCLQTYVN